MTPIGLLAASRLPVLLILATCAWGCQLDQAGPISVRAIGRGEFDWSKVSNDYDGTMFDIIEITLDGKRAKFIGFCPEPDRYFKSLDPYRTPHSMDILSVGSRHNAWLFLMVTQGRLLGLLVSDTQSPAFSAPITSEDMSCCRDNFAELNDQTVYVEPAFHEVLLERGVRLPAHYQVMRHKYWDSQERQWDPEAQK